MNELKVFNFNEVDVVDSRGVAEMVDRNHKDLLRDIRNYVEILEKSNERKIAPNEFFIESSYKDSIGRTLPCYLLTKKGCDMVANKMTGEKGVLFTAAYVTAFEVMRQRMAAPILPKDYPSALRALAEAEEQRMALEEQRELDRPKVLFADAVSTAKTSILIGELAKLLKQNGVPNMGQNRLFDWMRRNGFLIRRSGGDYNMPTQRAMELGLFEIKDTAITHADGHTSVNKTPKITGKGQQYFVRVFLSREKEANHHAQSGADR